MKLKPNPDLNWPIDYEAAVLPIAASENCRLKAYLCQAGRWTCGWGETDGVGPTTVWTQEYADQRLCDSLGQYVQEVLVACAIEPTTYQLVAMVSLAYNIGLGWKGKIKPAGAKNGFRQSSVLRAHNRGDFLAASRAFGLWNKYTDPKSGQLRDSTGLTARRAKEAALYLQRPPEEEYKMPQAVNGESPMTSSPIAQSGAVTVGAGVVGAIGSAGDQVGVVSGTVNTVKSFAVETLGIPPDWFLPALLILVGGLILWYRAKQRSQGWA